MIIVQVDIHIKPELTEEFKKVTIENALASLQEPGVARFDVIQDSEDLTHFMLVEAYRKAEAAASHRGSSHFNKWREVAEPMMTAPRTRMIFANVFPPDSDW